MKKLIAALCLIPALAFSQSPTPRPLYQGLGIKSDGTLSAPAGSVSLADPAFGGPLPSAQLPASQPYGTLYNVNSWTGLSDFVVTGATASVVSNKIQLSGGNNSPANTLERLPYTCLPRWKVTARILTGAISGTSYGVGLGIHGYVSGDLQEAIGRIDLTSNGTAGNVYFGQTGNGGTYTDEATSATHLTWSAGDYIVLSVLRDNDNFVVEAYDDTTHSAVVSVSFRVPVYYGWSSTMSLPNTGRFGVFTWGGTQTLDSLKIESASSKNADLCIVGDSKSAGNAAPTYPDSYACKLASAATVVNLSGPGDTTASVLLRVPEIIALTPRTVLLNIGRNDVGIGSPSGTYLANYDSIVSQLASAGIKVVHLLPIYETAANQTTLTSHITSTYSAYIDSALSTWSGTASTVLSPDNVHPNGFGHEQIYRAIIAYFGWGDRVHRDYNIPSAFLSGGSDTLNLSNYTIVGPNFNQPINQAPTVAGVTLGTVASLPSLMLATGTASQNWLAYNNAGQYTMRQNGTDYIAINSGAFQLTNGMGLTVLGSGAISVGASGVTINSGGSLIISGGGGFLLNGASPSVFLTSAISASAIDWSVKGPFTKTIAANTTFTFANQADGQKINVAVTNTGSYTVTWPTVSWTGGTAPTQTTGFHTDVYEFQKIGGAIYGSVKQNY